MNREQRILASMLASKAAYQEILPIREEKDFSEQGWLLVEEIDNYYDNDGKAESIDKGLIKDVIARKHPRSARIINSVIDDMNDVSVANSVSEYIDLKKESLEHQLADMLLAGEDYSDILEKLQNVNVLEEAEESTVYINTDLEDILSATSPENLIQVSPPSLNERLDGGLVPGTQMAIYAPTEVGKSMVSINLARGFLSRGHKVLYCGNEDPSKSMLLRMYSCLTGMTKEELRASPQEARKKAAASGYNNLIFKELQPGSLREIRALVEKYEPDILFVDQMANMEHRSSSKVEKNEALACGLRAMAKRYEFVSVIIHQASDDAYGKNILEKNHMYYSNVGVQAQMDVMIGIGMDASYEQQDLRMFCLTKNKLSGNHENFPVTVVPALSRVEEA